MATKKKPVEGAKKGKKVVAATPRASRRKKEPFRLEEGKSYKAVNGITYGPMMPWDSKAEPMFYDRYGNGLWYPNGKRYKPTASERKWDLVREVKPVKE